MDEDASEITLLFSAGGRSEMGWVLAPDSGGNVKDDVKGATQIK